jgi:hypothetical protein
MGDLVFVAVVVAFFAVTVGYVKGCERIVGRDRGGEAFVGADADDAATVVEASAGTTR